MNKEVGCLVIHGFGGDITEIQPLVSCLIEEGFRVMAPSLKGHTGKRKDIRNVSYKDWIMSAEEDLLKLLPICDVVYIIGFSMGGLIAFNLSNRYKIGGIVTINTPIYFWSVKRIIVNIVTDIAKRDLKNIKRYIKASTQLPFSALLNFNLLLRRTKSIIKEIRCPIYVIQAINDDTVRNSSAKFIFNNVGSDDKKIKLFDSSEHRILCSSEADMVIGDILEYLSKRIK